MAKQTRLEQLRDEWSVLSLYQRFESLVALTLTGIIAIVIVVALFRLALSVITGLLVGALDPLDQGVFQLVFGEVLTLLISLLALARKVIVLDLKETAAGELLGLA